LISIVVLVVTIAGIYFYFRIKNITVSGLQTGETVQGLTTIYQKQIFLVDEEELAKNIKKNNPYVKEVQVKKVYPDSIQLNIWKYPPLAVLKLPEGFFILSQDGRILTKERNNTFTTLPTMTFYQKLAFKAYKPGEFLTFSDMLQALEFTQALKNFSFTVDTIDIKGTNMIACNLIIDAKPSTILFSTEKGLDQQLYELNTILKKFSQDSTNFKKIDLRFNRPVVEL